MITIHTTGNFNNTERFLDRIAKGRFYSKLNRYGEQGVKALAAATPMDSGETAASWYYEVEDNGNQASIIWKNSHVNKGVNIAIILQYGHGTGTGGYVEGRDYINPAIRPIFDDIAEAVWMEVTRS